MSQSNVIAGALVIAFLMFITVRGELPQYVELFTVKRKTKGAGGDNFKSSISGYLEDGEAWFNFGNDLLNEFGGSEETPDGEQTEI